MTNELSKFVESWFFDTFCKGEDCKDRGEFIDRVWKLYRYDNDYDIDNCIEAAVENGLAVHNSWHDIRNDLADYAGDVIFELWTDGDLPDYYADMYEIDVYGDDE